MFKAKANISGALKLIKQCEKQSRFALAMTYTQAAFESRKAVQKNLPKWLTLRSKFLESSVIVQKADTRTMKAVVGFHKRARFAPLLEAGGTRRPKGRFLAIPQGVRASESAKIPKRLRPEALRGRKDVFRKTINGLDGLWQSLPGRRLKLLYNFAPSAQYDKKIYFRKTAAVVAMKTIAQNARKNYERAMRNAK